MPHKFNLIPTQGFFIQPQLQVLCNNIVCIPLSCVLPSSSMIVGLSFLELVGIALGGAFGVLFVLICGFAAGVVAVYYLRLRKRRKIKAGL